MCYADTSVLPIGWLPNSQSYFTTFNTRVQKTCRDFDAIYEWAKERQTPWIPPGNGGVDLMAGEE
jgi:hypothetical protein